jgi:hypothetical protein
LQYICVRVVDGSGTPCADEKVTIHGNALFTGGSFPAQWTSREGVAEFAIDISPTDSITVSAKGQPRYVGPPKAKITVVI